MAVVTFKDLEREHHYATVGDPNLVNVGLRVAYSQWREHHAKCPYCKVHDWYDPGAPKIVPEAEWESWMTKHVDKDGKEFRIIQGPDPSVLCRMGRDFFTAWVRQSMNAQARRSA